MSHVPFRDGEDFEASFDFVVVGSGAGGAAAAVTLARAGRSVAIVEAGAWREPEDYPHTAYGAMRDLMDDWSSQVTMGRALWPVVQARTVKRAPAARVAGCTKRPVTPTARFPSKSTRSTGADEMIVPPFRSTSGTKVIAMLCFFLPRHPCRHMPAPVQPFV